MKCANCNAALNAGDQFCGECGKQVTAHAAPSEVFIEPQPVGPSSNVVTTLFGAALLIFFIVLGISFIIAIFSTVKELF